MPVCECLANQGIPEGGKKKTDKGQERERGKKREAEEEEERRREREESTTNQQFYLCNIGYGKFGKREGKVREQFK